MTFPWDSMKRNAPVVSEEPVNDPAADPVSTVPGGSPHHVTVARWTSSNEIGPAAPVPVAENRLV